VAGIQDGLAAFESGAESSSPEVAGWKYFFDGLFTGSADENELKHRWGVAKQIATRHGIESARDLTPDPLTEVVTVGSAVCIVLHSPIQSSHWR